jgi:hypothetical protein
MVVLTLNLGLLGDNPPAKLPLLPGDRQDARGPSTTSSAGDHHLIRDLLRALLRRTGALYDWAG